MVRYFLLIFFASALAASGQSIDDLAIESSAGVSRVIPTNAFLRATNDNSISLDGDIRASFRFSPTTRYGQLYPNVRQGMGITVFGFAPHSSFGTPFGAYLFQNVDIYNRGRWTLEAGWVFGVTAPWRHYNQTDQAPNTAIGSKVNAALGINAAIIYRLSGQWALRGAVTADHYSNGNTTLPNPGINTIGFELGAIYTLKPPQNHTFAASDLLFDSGMSYDLTIYGAPRCRIAHDSGGTPVAIPGRFGVVGLSLAPMYDINRYFRAGAAVDIQYDESANIDRHLAEGTYGDDVKFYRQPFSERMSAGLSVRGELTLAMFGLNFGIGRNLVARGENRVFYQTLALKIHVINGAFINIGYRLSDFHRPENLMLGVGYTFGRKI